jgi:hypothetical protein
MKNPAFSHTRSLWSDLDSISGVILNIAQRPPASRLPPRGVERILGLCPLHSTRADTRCLMLLGWFDTRTRFPKQIISFVHPYNCHVERIVDSDRNLPDPNWKCVA